MRATLRNVFGYSLFAELRGLDTRALPWNFRLFWIPQNISTSIKSPQKILAKFSYQKNSGIENVKSKKKTFNHPRHLEIRISPRPAGCVNRITLKLLLLIRIVYPTLLAESLSFFLGKFTLRVSRVSNQSFNIPSQSTPWTFEFFSKINIQIPTTWAKMPFKYPIIVSF